MTRDWSLAGLLGPVGRDDFLAKHWQIEPLHVARGEPRYFSELVGREQVDHLIASQCGRADFPISVIGGHLEKKEAPEPGPAARSSWTPEAVYKRIGKGATIRIGNTKHYIPAIRRLAACLEQELSSDIAINLYMTPPAARAFGAHYDNHDVFILQVEGEKLWTIRSPAAELPLEAMFRGREEWLKKPLPYETSLKTLPPEHSSRTIRLVAGDMLYVPRGHVHEVMTGDCASLHLTVAAPVVTWYEVAVHALLAAARRSPALRTALPPGFATDAAIRAEAARRAPEMVAALAAHLHPDDLARSLDTLADQFVYSREGDWQGAGADMLRMDGIGVDTMLRVRPGLGCNAHAGGADLMLVFAGRSLKLPIRAESMVRHVLAARAFRVGDLPTPLSDESRIVLAKLLVENGLLTFVDPG
jgi:ribosomal protein L16 Arg81 hydroxylase